VENEGDRLGEPEEPAAAPVRPRRKLLPVLFLAGGALLASYLTSRSPRDQHLSLVLGPAADQVTQLEIQYLAPDGDLARDARMTFELGRAPRVVSHEPQLADGDYRLRIDLDTREGRRSVERRVTLGGGTTQVDLTGPLTSPATPSASQPPSSPQLQTAP
jgi:hypothetical protein